MDEKYPGEGEGPLRKQNTHITDLWADYHRTRSEVSRNALAEHHLSTVKYVAAKMKIRLPNHVEIEDLEQLGTLGLFESIRRFDPERGIAFKTYCVGRIRGAILDGMRAQDWVPRLTRARSNKLFKARRKLEETLERPPTDEEFARELKMPLKDFHGLLVELEAALPFGKHRRTLDPEGAILGVEHVQDTRVSDPAENSSLRDMVSVALEFLEPRQRYALVMYVFEDMTLREIGWVLGISESRACQIMAKLMERLRERMGPSVTALDRSA